MNNTPLHFIGEEIKVLFDSPPVRQKTPHCPDGFTWQECRYRVIEKISEWHDFTRRGRMARNMRPSHAMVAAGRGSLGVGRFYFRVRTDTGRIFDIYYDREIKDVDDRLGHWFIYREMAPDSLRP
jgi:Domain of unknown function (DUF6504)